MSIRPTVIDNNGHSPCIPQLALLGAMRAAAPTPPDNGIAAMALLTAIAIALVLAADWIANLLR